MTNVSPNSAQGGTVYVVGAGFTRAFVEYAPLMRGFLEMHAHLIDPTSKTVVDRFIPIRDFIQFCGMDTKTLNIETLLTFANLERAWLNRADAIRQSLAAELLTQLIAQVLKDRIRKSPINRDTYTFQVSDLAALQSVSRAILTDASAHVITFNYDTLLENFLALEQNRMIAEGTSLSVPPRFNIGHSYGFSGMQVQGNGVVTPPEPFVFPTYGLFFLKLHGSMNWFPRKLHGQPTFPGDLLVMSPHEKQLFYPEQEVFLDTDHPFIIPPILDKSALLKSPIVSVLWGWAGDIIRQARRLIFLGYSFPPTDYFTEFLFRSNTHRDTAITVVDLASENDTGKRDAIKSRYSEVFSGKRVWHFDFGGALQYARQPNAV